MWVLGLTIPFDSKSRDLTGISGGSGGSKIRDLIRVESGSKIRDLTGKKLLRVWNAGESPVFFCGFGGSKSRDLIRVAILTICGSKICDPQGIIRFKNS